MRECRSSGSVGVDGETRPSTRHIEHHQRCQVRGTGVIIVAGFVGLLTAAEIKLALDAKL